MSLINKMLQDLEARRAVDAFGDGNLQAMSAVSVQRTGVPYRLVALIMIGMVLVAAVYFVTTAKDPVPAAPSSLIAPPPAPASVPAMPATPPGVVAGPPTQEASVAVAPPDATQEVSATASNALQPAATSIADPVASLDGLRIETSLSQAPSTQPPSSAKSLKSTSPPHSRPVETRRLAGDEPPVKPSGKSQERPRIEKTAIATTPRSRAEMLLSAARSSLSDGHHLEAEELLRKSLTEDPSYTAARRLLLRLYWDQRKQAEVEQLLRDGMSSSPSVSEWPLALARVYVERGDTTLAQALLSEVQSRLDKDPEYHGFVGALAYRQNRIQEAIDAYLVASRLAAGEGRWWLGLGLALEAGQRRSDAREAYRRARATGTLNPDLMALVDQKLR